MEKFEISIDKQLKEQMQKYDTDWSEVCRQAIQEELERLENDETNVKDLIDTDVDNITSVQNQSEVLEFPRKIYKTLEKAWKKTFGEGNSEAIKNFPSSNTIKKWWKNWYDSNYDIIGYYPFPDEEDIRLVLPNYPDSIQDELVHNFYFICEESKEIDDNEQIDYSSFVYFISRFLFFNRFLEINEIDAFTLDYIHMENKDNLPEESGIYFVRDDQNLYYIGMTKNLQERWYDHHRQDDFDKISNLKIAYLKGIPLHYLSSIETTLIEYFKPQLNIRDNPLLKR